jgi:hypothetical protein
MSTETDKDETARAFGEAVQAALKVERDRKAFTDALRDLANWLDVHPEAPIASFGTLIDLDVSVYGATKEQLVALARKPGAGPFSKGYSSSLFELTRSFGGGVRYSACGDREQVCERVVVGEETVEVPEQPYVAAHTETRPITEWKCHPLIDQS